VIVLDPKLLLMLATGTLLLLNGLIARSAARRAPESAELADEVAPAEQATSEGASSAQA
jgi:hypothetical protein